MDSLSRSARSALGSASMCEPGDVETAKGAPYRPANGREGDWFTSRWCANCTRDQDFQRDPQNHDGCPIVADTMALGEDDPDYPKEWVYDAAGQPVCTAFEPALEPTAPSPESVLAEPSAEAEGRANNTSPTTQEEQP